ncbi:hypothetical protein GCM10018793_69080 [Streptomyces sulfonofaciens]|uniref:DUF2795 domain-containing protein n=1 Tax=Streptomyces sulfonofaciens TaxID=68272 RepID=A0A919GRW3_9ACTN|nr:DUF2795 domain-containing protein [Streptomyces sulfonofaciens]GHH88650.1 hypothetical protein GCM10018793_69080 [Streptomyces sulfonofaciens]
MQRGSDRLSVHRDEEMKAELRGLLTSGHPTRSEEWHDPEPSAEDDPEVAGGPVTPQRSPGAVDALHYELARNLGRAAFPAKPGRLRAALRDRHAPDELAEQLKALPGDVKYTNAHEVAEALVRARREA